MVLLRHLLGDVLRRLRLRQGRTLREVSAAARVSLGYLSEVERGQKEASSELLAAICSALGVPLSRVLGEVSDGFALAELQSAAGLGAPQEPALAGRPAPHDRELVGAPARSAAIPGVRRAVLEGPVAAREVLTSRMLRHEIIGGDGNGARRPFGTAGTSRIGDIKDMVPV
jgi:XRE family transcriptional regulator, stress-response regulator